MSTTRPAAMLDSEITKEAGYIKQRRELLKTFSLSALTAALPFATPGAAGAAEQNVKGKLVFVLFRRPDLTHEQSVAQWKGDMHVALVRKVPGLQKWVQNHPISAPAAGSPDGIGELWFADAETMGKAMSSPEMGAAGEDAKRFLDMEKSFAIVVSENSVIG